MKTLKKKNPAIPKTWDKIKLEWRFTHNSDYMISNKGDVLNIKKNKFVKKTYHKVNEKRAYEVVRIVNEVHYVHRLVAIAFYGLQQDKVVHHIDGDTFNNRATNLRWCTQSENIKLAKRVAKRLTQPWEVEQAQVLFEQGVTPIQVSNILGISYLTSWRIWKGLTYQNVHRFSSIKNL